MDGTKKLANTKFCVCIQYEDEKHIHVIEFHALYSIYKKEPSSKHNIYIFLN
jgi:hypothetical protein